MVALVFATIEEASPFLRQHTDRRFDGIEEGEHVRSGSLIFAVTGSGKINAAIGVDRLLQEYEVDVIVHAGQATSLSGEVEPGSLMGATFVLEGDRVDLDDPVYPRMPLEMPFDSVAEGTLVSQDHPSADTDERSYWERIADMRDTTGYAVTYVAAQHGIPCHIVKGITDRQGRDHDPDDETAAYEAVAALLRDEVTTIAGEIQD